MEFKPRSIIKKTIPFRRNIGSNIHLNLSTVSIIPKTACWSDMEGFMSRKYGPFVFHFRNSKGDIVAGIRLYVTYNCNGKYNSTGHYLSKVGISPYEIFSNMGYDLTCDVSASGPINFGTKEEPIAGVILKVTMKLKSYKELLSTVTSYTLDSLIQNQNEATDTELLIVETSSLENSMNDYKKEDYDKQEKLEINSEADDRESNNNESNDSERNSMVNKELSNRARKDDMNAFKGKVANMITSNKYKVNTEMQFLNVIIRGDCQVSILSGTGY